MSGIRTSNVVYFMSIYKSMYDVEGLLKNLHKDKLPLQKRILKMFDIAMNDYGTFFKNFDSNFVFILKYILPLVIQGLEDDIDEILMSTLEHSEKIDKEGKYLQTALSIKRKKDDFDFLKSVL